MTQPNDKDRAERPPKETSDKRAANQTVKDLEPKDTNQVKGGRRTHRGP